LNCVTLKKKLKEEHYTEFRRAVNFSFEEFTRLTLRKINTNSRSAKPMWSLSNQECLRVTEI